ncbi:LamB/YcsF family protein [Mesobacillus campisalis]|uniref:5-oxoprolinase subunit A n=1 Tax=Mesobacillus campisalis TaxID=1408103 RepID=A0A0M2SW48_9BACI|nr:5-oxoprolinase subunit PxpA [Mesobacillus campisalis]KKK37197.1 LamB/YcsF family protein [Mesobacillus campisalis]
MMKVDLNCDIGESFGAYSLGNDEELLSHVTSANIACGFHAGDPSTMRKTVRMALKKNVAIGAHPGLKDLEGFGRREMQISPQEAHDLVTYQIGALYAFVKSEGACLQHVKPHGALYNMAARDANLAEAIAKSVYKIDPGLILLGLANSELIKAGTRLGLRTANEAFADRTYQEDGSLTSRKTPNSVLEDDKKAVKQVMDMLRKNEVISIQGTPVPITAESICLHGDGAKAAAFARQIRHSLELAEVRVEKLGSFV